jgi:hypothetical protein
VTEYRLVAEPRVDLDVAAAYQWCEHEQPGLGPFPYAVYFAVEAQFVVVLAVLHASRDPAAWQWRGH